MNMAAAESKLVLLSTAYFWKKQTCSTCVFCENGRWIF